jgi:hypothetical protein
MWAKWVTSTIEGGYQLQQHGHIDDRRFGARLRPQVQRCRHSLPIVNDKCCSCQGQFSLTCDETFDPPRLLYKGDIRILNISLEVGEMHVVSPVSYVCYNSSHRVDLLLYRVHYFFENQFWKVCHDQWREVGGQKLPLCLEYCFSYFQLVKDDANLYT